MTTPRRSRAPKGPRTTPKKTAQPAPKKVADASKAPSEPDGTEPTPEGFWLPESVTSLIGRQALELAAAQRQVAQLTAERDAALAALNAK